MMRVNAYEYLLMEHNRRKDGKNKKKKSIGFQDVLKEEEKKLERRTEMKLINVALTIPELLMIQELSDTRNMEFEYSWQRSVAESKGCMPKACDEPVGLRTGGKSRIRQVAGEGHCRADGARRGCETKIYIRRAEKRIKKERHGQ